MQSEKKVHVQVSRVFTQATCFNVFNFIFKSKKVNKYFKNEKTVSVFCSSSLFVHNDVGLQLLLSVDMCVCLVHILILLFTQSPMLVIA